MNKLKLALGFSLLSILTSYGQKTVVSTSRFSILYHDFPNKLDIAVSNRPCSDLIINTNNGVMTKIDSCTYELKTARPGQAWIVISSVTGSIYDSLDFRVKMLPKPKALFLYNQNDRGKIRPTGNMGIMAQLDDFDYDIDYNIKSYTTTWIRGSDTISSATCDNYKLCDKARRFVEEMDVGNKIVFSDIIAVGLFDIEYKLDNIEYVLIDN